MITFLVATLKENNMTSWLKKLFLITAAASALPDSDAFAQSGDIAEILVRRGLTKIADAGFRKGIIFDQQFTVEKYDSDQKLKSRKEELKTVRGEPSLRGLKISYLYQALLERYEFYLDPSENAVVIGETTYIVVKYRPKPDLKARRTEDHFINRISGRVYLDVDNLNPVRIEGGVENTFSFTQWLFIIPVGVDVYRFGFNLEYAPFGEMVVERAASGLTDYQVKNRVLEKYAYFFTNYRTP